MAVSRFAEVHALEQEVADLHDRLETRKTVDRAKAVLQDQLGLSEPDAFRWIQKTAMDLRLSMREVAAGRRRPRSRARARTPDGSTVVRTVRSRIGNDTDRYVEVVPIADHGERYLRAAAPMSGRSTPGVV